MTTPGGHLFQQEHGLSPNHQQEGGLVFVVRYASYRYYSGQFEGVLWNV